MAPHTAAFFQYHWLFILCWCQLHINLRIQFPETIAQSGSRLPVGILLHMEPHSGVRPSKPSAGQPPFILLVTHSSSVQSANCVSFLTHLKMLTLNSESSRVLSHRLESPASSPVLAGFTCSAEIPSPEFHPGHPSLPSTIHSTIWLLSMFVVVRFA